MVKMVLTKGLRLLKFRIPLSGKDWLRTKRILKVIATVPEGAAKQTLMIN